MIVILIGLLIAAYIAQYYSLEHGLDRVSYRMDMRRGAVEPGELFELRTTVENRKWLMIPFLKIQEKVPKEMAILEGDGMVKDNGAYQSARLVAECYLGRWQKVELLRQVAIEKRGWYGFYGVTLSAGDFLGLSSRSMDISQSREIVVKPRPAVSQNLDKVLGGFLGEISVRRFWMEDPMYLSGYRDYSGREPMKSISWMMTAKNNRLMVKEFDHTAELTCTVLLDTSYRAFWEIEESSIEQCFSIARTVCESLEAQGFTYGFMTNATVAGYMGIIHEKFQGKGAAHLEEILEMLGRADCHFNEHLAGLLQRVLAGRTPGRACILISLSEVDECKHMIERIRDLTGCEVLILRPDVLANQTQEEGKAYGAIGS